MDSSPDPLLQRPPARNRVDELPGALLHHAFVDYLAATLDLDTRVAEIIQGRTRSAPGQHLGGHPGH